MKWFKHLADSHNDPDLCVAREKFGHAALTVFWLTLELYAKEFDHYDPGTDGFIRLSWVDYRNKLRIKTKQTEFILTFYQNRGRIISKRDGEYLLVKIPKFVDMADEYTARKMLKDKKNVGIQSGHSPENIQPEVEVDVEVDRDLKKESTASTTPPLSPKGGRGKIFTRPTLEDVASYCRDRGNGIDPQTFLDHYTTGGWVIGKNRTPMKDWQAAVRTWEQRRQREVKPGNEGYKPGKYAHLDPGPEGGV